MNKISIHFLNKMCDSWWIRYGTVVQRQEYISTSRHDERLLQCGNPYSPQYKDTNGLSMKWKRIREGDQSGVIAPRYSQN